MGYNTRYEIELTPDLPEVRASIEADEDLSYAVGECADECKWYDHEADMLAFSRRYPDVLFTLNGAGEEPGDLWRKYFKNGKMHGGLAEIVYESFDESKLR